MNDPAESQALLDLGSRVVDRARRAGADVAEVSAHSGWELSVRVRMGAPELVEEAGTKGLTLRVIQNERVAVTSTTDLSESGIEHCVRDAIMLVTLSEPDPLAMPPDQTELAVAPFPDLDLFDPEVATIDAERAIDLAMRGEKAAFAFDDRIRLSEGATFSRNATTSALVLSSGFVGVKRGTFASLVVSPVVEDTDNKKRRGHYWSGQRHVAQLESPEEVGTEAARRALAKLGPRKVETRTAPVIFDREVARSIVQSFAGCCLGGSLWRRASYLLDRVGTPVASPLVTLIDDPLRPRAPGSRAFDGEGRATKRRIVVEQGVLQTYLLDTYSARKLGLRPTGSSSRSGGTLSATTSNFHLQPGKASREELLREVGSGLCVTDMMGFGFNPVTGDFSRGASGFWVQDGQVAFPVSEVTVSANLDTMLKGIVAIANDLDEKTSTASPTFAIESMTISGQ